MREGRGNSGGGRGEGVAEREGGSLLMEQWLCFTFSIVIFYVTFAPTEMAVVV